MADALGIVGVIGVIAQIIQIGVKFGGAWKDVPGDVRRFLAELQAMRLVLTETNNNVVRSQDFCNAFRGHHSTLLSQLEGTQDGPSDGKVLVETCHKELHALLYELQTRGQGHRLGLERLKGAFKAAKTRDSVQNLHRYCQSLNWMMAMDSLALQARANLDIMDMRTENDSRYAEMKKEQSEWRGEDTKATNTILDSLDVVHREQTEVSDRLPGFDRLISDHDDDSSHEIINSFSKLASRERQAFVLKNRHPDTGGFLLDSPDFKDWVAGRTRIIWGIGAPGTGKTVLVSAVVSTLEEKARAYLYCTHAEQNSQTLEEMIGSLVQQLLWQTNLPQETVALYKMHKGFGTRPGLPELVDQLELITFKFERVYIIVDALDECPETTRYALLEQLCKLKLNVQLFFTSRPLGNIETLQDATRFKIVSPEDDMRKSLTLQIRGEQRLLALCRKHEGLEAEILNQIIAKTDGMFLLAKLHVQSIAGQLRVGTVRKALTTLPDKLNDTYDDTINRIQYGQDKQKSEVAMRVLMLLSTSFRLLKLGEIQHALLAMELADEEFDPSDFYDVDQLLEMCGGLVILEDETSRLTFVHHTTETYFETNKNMLFQHYNYQMTSACIKYLSLDAFNSPCGTVEEFKERVKKWPLYLYAAEKWGAYARDADCADCTDLIMDFLGRGRHPTAASQVFTAHMVCFDPRFQGGKFEAMFDGQDYIFDTKMTSMHIAAAFGLNDVVVGLFDKGHESDPKDVWGRTPLSWAAQQGQYVCPAKTPIQQGQYLSLAKTLVRHGADTNSAATSNGHEGQTPLVFAARGGHEDMVKWLLDQGADSALRKIPTHYMLWDKSPRWELRTSMDGPTYWVDRLGVKTPPGPSRHQPPIEVEVSKAVERSAHVQNPNHWMHDADLTATQEAAKSGHDGVIHLLLNHNVQINGGRHCRQCPLVEAAEAGHQSTVELLLGRGADPNASSWRLPPKWEMKRDKRSRLFFVDHVKEITTWYNPRQIVKKLWNRREALLLAEGPPILDTHGATAISHSAAHGYIGIVTKLLEAGANPGWKDSLGRTPLIYAARFGHLEIVNALVVTGTELTVSDDLGCSAMSYAKEHGHEDIVFELHQAISAQILEG